MALSSDELVKRELIDSIGVEHDGLTARVFPEGSNQDQRMFDEGGLTFSYQKSNYGSCDLAYVYSQTNKANYYTCFNCHETASGKNFYAYSI